MKKFLFILFIFIAKISFAQQDYPKPYQNLGSLNVVVRDTGGLFVRQTFTPPQFTDTIAANVNPYTKSFPGSMIFTTSDDNFWVRNAAVTKWLNLQSFMRNDTLFAQLPLFFDSLTRAPSTIIKLLQGNGVIGGNVTLDSCNTIHVSPGTLTLNYKTYSFPFTTLTVPPSDPSNPRLDYVIVDTLGQVSILEGTPATPALPPTINPSSQFILSQYTFDALATCLSITQEIIYDENSGSPEWAVSMFGIITSNPDNTDKPYHLTKAIFNSTYTNGSGLIFTKPSGTSTLGVGEIFKGFVYFNGLFTNQIQMAWYNDASAVSNSIILNPYVNLNDSNNYQIFTVPMTAWNFTSSSFNKLIITFAGDDTSGAKGLYFDWLQLQTGFINNNAEFTLTTTGDSCSGATYNNITHVLNIPPCSGGGSTGNTIYTADDALVSDRTVNLNGHFLDFTSNLTPFFSVDPSSPDNEFSRFRVVQASNPTTLARLDLNVIGGTSIHGELTGTFDGEENFKILGIADETSSSLAYTADTHIFTGSILYDSPVSGASTDSVITWDASTKTLNMRDVSSFGGNQTLQQVFDVQNANAILNKDDTISINRHNFLLGEGFGSNLNGLLIVDSSSSGTGAESLLSASYSSSGNVSRLQASSDANGASFDVSATNNAGGFHVSDIFATTDNTQSSIGYTADTHTFTGIIVYNTPPNGTSTDSVLTRNASTGIINMRAASSFGSSTSFAFNENHTGSTSTTITLAHNYISGTIRVFKNGSRLQIPNGFTEATANTLTLSSAPLSSDNFTIDFNY